MSDKSKTWRPANGAVGELQTGPAGRPHETAGRQEVLEQRILVMTREERDSLAATIALVEAQWQTYLPWLWDIVEKFDASVPVGWAS